MLSLFKNSGDFTISENNNIASFGRIYTTEDDSLHIQNLIYDKKFDDNNSDCESITLDANDVYKELRIRGYDYGPKFRGIQELKFENFNEIHGKVLWTGNWVSFMDALLQTQIVALPFRKMFVPVMISSLRCDPKVLFDAIEESKQSIYEENDYKKNFNYAEVQEDQGGFKTKDSLSIEEEIDSEKQYEEVVKDFESQKKTSILNFVTDIHLRTVVTHGIEVKGLWAVPIPRRSAAQDLKLESYQFIPNEENDAIEEFNRKEITEYIKV
jgi:hypothetical protein